MTVIQVNTKPYYSVRIENDLLKDIGRLVSYYLRGKVFLLTDKNVDHYYGEEMITSLASEGIVVEKYVVEGGEESKSLSCYGEILEKMAELNFHRNDSLVAFGGGVVGDLGGFVAATFQRGIDYIQIPTTLLAAVDSSVGGKTAINLKAGKNLAGAFKQPKIVYCDPKLFKTMERTRFSDGIAESIKYGILRDPELFYLFEQPLQRDEERISSIVEKCVGHKAEVVERDEFEKGERQFLNLGHTIGHAIEKCSDFNISHGHAVAIGMAIMARACAHLGILQEEEKDKILSVLQKNDLPLECEYSSEELFQQVYRDKKVQGEEITIVEIKAIGHCRLHKMPIKEFKKYIEKGRK